MMKNRSANPDDPSAGRISQHPARSSRKHKPLMIVLDLLIILMAFSGLYLIIKPIYIHWQQDQLTKQLLDAYNQGDGTILIDPTALIVEGEDVEYVTDIETQEPTTESAAGTSEAEPDVTPAVTPSPTPSPTPLPARVSVKAIGRIRIPRINVDMPITEGATVYNLRVAIGHYTKSAGLGQTGNSILFGHRMYTYGRHFNRLGEMVIGDEIIIEDRENRYTYTVDGIDRILPVDLPAALYAPVEGSRIMLVTCDPVRIASHRLLVKGVLTATEALP